MSLHDDTHPLTRAELVAATSRPIGKGVKTAAMVLAVLGTIVWIVGLFLSPDRAWRAFHVNWLYFTTVSSAGVMFVAVQRITTARWSRPVIRLLEGYVAFLPVAFVFLILSLTFGKNHIFPWAVAPSDVAEKRMYLNYGFFLTRDIVLFGVLVLLQIWYIWTCVRLDVGLVPEWGAKWAAGWREKMRTGYGEERREIHSTHSLQGKLSVVMTMLFAFFWSVLSWDLSMSLDLHYQSTLYSWWFFMSAWVGALASFTLLTIWWRKHLDAYDIITEHHFHDLGKLCFAFTAFWGYLTFGQYLVTWYGNMGEETHFWRLRLILEWKPLGVTVAVMMFAIPFFGLMFRSAKVFLPTLIAFTFSTVIGLWLQRYLEVYPSLYGEHTVMPGLWEFGTLAMYLGIWGLCYIGFMDAFPRVRVTFMTSPFRDEVQVPVDPETMEPLPAHE